MRIRLKKGSSEMVSPPDVATWRAYCSELDKGRDRLGNTHTKVMKWVLSFAQENLGSLSAGGWTDMRYELAHFTQWGAFDFKSSGDDKTSFPRLLNEQKITISFPDWRSLVPKREVPTNATPTDMWYVYNLPGRKAAKDLQKIARECLEELLINGKTSFTLSQVTIHAQYDKPHDTGLKYIASRSPKVSFGFHLISIIAQYAARIRRCTGCSFIFLAEKKNHIYHSNRCLSLINMRRKRNTPPERFGKPGRPKKKNSPKKEKES